MQHISRKVGPILYSVIILSYFLTYFTLGKDFETRHDFAKYYQENCWLNFDITIPSYIFQKRFVQKAITVIGRLFCALAGINTLTDLSMGIMRSIIILKCQTDIFLENSTYNMSNRLPPTNHINKLTISLHLLYAYSL